MLEQYKISKMPELLKKITLNLPVRRSQVANWGVRLLKIDKPFYGHFMGQPMEIRPLEAASRSAYFLGFYERETTAWVLDYFRREQPKTIIDVGAHFGYFIYLALAELESSTIYAFEPDPNNRSWLKRNLSMVNSNNTVHVEATAISNKKGTVKFLASNPELHNNLWAGINLNNKVSEHDIEVPSIPLDSFCAEKGLSDVDLVIMDIEGAEGFAVDGMLDGIKKQIYKNVLLEFHPDFLSGEHSPDQIIKKFTSAGYKAYHFQSPYGDNLNTDKQTSFYDLSWRESYLVQIKEDSVHLSGWEHILFCK